MKISTGYRLDSRLVDEINQIAKNRNMTIAEIFKLAINIYNVNSYISRKKNKKMLSLYLDDDLISKIKELAEKNNVKSVDVVNDIFQNFLTKKIL